MRQLFVYIMALTVVLVGCTTAGEYREMLSRAEGMMNSHPDSALMILESLGQHEKEFDSHFRMQYILHRTNAQSKTGVTFISDSLTRELTNYFNRHGSTNERLLAYYLLGMAYSDMGEAPKAIGSFQDAIDAADTTATDFNFHQLSCAYSQMATIYHRQLLLTNEIEARKKASYYAFRANQIRWGIYNQAMSAGAYILLDKKDSAEIILKSVLEQYRKNGYMQDALLYSRLLIHLYVERPDRLADAKALMDQFEEESVLFDAHHELPPSMRQYYDYKGRYFEGIRQLDSAEFYYRKIHRPGMSYTSQDPMYRGLLSVFSKRHQTDSIAKYAQLYCMANDSSIVLKDREQIAQMTALYNYNRLQKESHENEVKAYRKSIGLMIAMILIGLLIIAAIFGWRYYQEKIKKLKTRFADAVEEYEDNLHELQLLEKTHQTVIGSIQGELEKAQGESNDLRKKFVNAQKTISQINQDYEDEKARLLEANKELNKKIEELQKNEAISKYVEISESFKKQLIVVQILNLADKRTIPVKEAYWEELTRVFMNSYPALYKDLCSHFTAPQHIRVCILTVLSIDNDSQAILLGTTKQRVSNVKSSINTEFFNEPTSRTLRKNLVLRYNLYGFERDSKHQKRTG